MNRRPELVIEKDRLELVMNRRLEYVDSKEDQGYLLFKDFVLGRKINIWAYDIFKLLQ